MSGKYRKYIPYMDGMATQMVWDDSTWTFWPSTQCLRMTRSAGREAELASAVGEGLGRVVEKHAIQKNLPSRPSCSLRSVRGMLGFTRALEEKARSSLGSFACLLLTPRGHVWQDFNAGLDAMDQRETAPR